MKKVLAIIAVVVVLLTTILFGYSILNDNSSDPDDLQGLISFMKWFLVSVFFLTIASEIALFMGIGLLISENRTPSKIVLGIVIIIICLIFLSCGLFFLWP